MAGQLPEINVEVERSDQQLAAIIPAQRTAAVPLNPHLRGGAGRTWDLGTDALRVELPTAVSADPVFVSFCS